MADFPSAVYSPRTKANKSGVVYDAAQTKKIYAEDITKLDAEIVAVETFLEQKIVKAANIVPFKNLVVKHVFSNLTSTGDNTVYTCPADKKALLTGIIFYNGAASSATIYIKTNIGGYAYRRYSAVSCGAGSNASQYLYNVFLEEGETLVINNSQQPLGVNLTVLEFDDDSALKRAILTSFSAGDNTLLEVPADKQVILVNQNNFFYSAYLNYVNESGGAITMAMFAVPSGEAKGTQHTIMKPTSYTNNYVTSTQTYLTGLSEGSKIIVNVSANTDHQLACLLYFEQDA